MYISAGEGSSRSGVPLNLAGCLVLATEDQDCRDSNQLGILQSVGKTKLGTIINQQAALQVRMGDN